MNGKYLLDTNIVIGLFANTFEIVDKFLQAGELYIPCIVIGELCYGAEKSRRSEENLERIDDFAHSNIILKCDGNTARY